MNGNVPEQAVKGARTHAGEGAASPRRLTATRLNPLLDACWQAGKAEEILPNLFRCDSDGECQKKMRPVENGGIKAFCGISPVGETIMKGVKKTADGARE